MPVPPTLSPSIARSWLLLPANRPGSFAAAQSSQVDVVVLDVEDGVPQAEKHQARGHVADWLAAGNRAWVRINDARSSEWEKDLLALGSLGGLQGVILAKTETAEHVALTSSRLSAGMPVVALIESAEGLVNAAPIARNEHVVRLAFGVGDYRRDTGMGSSALALAYTRSQLVIASRLAAIAAPIDGPTIPPEPDRLRAEVQTTVEMGMSGKLCLRTEQAPIINSVLSPSSDEVAWAVDVITALGINGERVKDGSDRPRLARAQKIARLAQAYGQPPRLSR